VLTNLAAASVDATAPNIVTSHTLSGAGTLTGSPISAGPGLGPLQDNGGPGPLTMLPGATGSAINAGQDDGCPATDQRGVPRPLGLACEIGAVELAPSLPGVVRQSTSCLLRNTFTAGPVTSAFSLGTPPLVPFTGDWDGNGTRTPGTYSGGVLSYYNEIPAVTATFAIEFGDARGFPVAGDFDGDGRDDVAIYRNGTWQIRDTATGAPSTVTFGGGAWPATVPVAGDWNGDGTDGIGTHTLANGTWTLRNATTGGAIPPFVFAPGASPYPVVGDWNGDGSDTVGVKSRSSAAWTLSNSNTTPAGDVTFNYGLANDLPLAWR
jgi:hypothetical protein